MREIKFRAWFDSDLFMDDDILVYKGVARLNNHGDLITLEGAVLMQYTGLKDKNGVDIYEGDILRTDNEDCDLRTIIDIRYCPSYHGLDCGDTDRFEVIGNIHENPELCKKQ